MERIVLPGPAYLPCSLVPHQPLHPLTQADRLILGLQDGLCFPSSAPWLTLAPAGRALPQELSSHRFLPTGPLTSAVFEVPGLLQVFAPAWCLVTAWQALCALPRVTAASTGPCEHGLAGCIHRFKLLCPAGQPCPVAVLPCLTEKATGD